MSNQYPFYTEPTHDTGTPTVDASNAARTTTESLAEERLIVEADNKIYLLEPNLHPFVTFLTSIGKQFNGSNYQGVGMLKKQVKNPEFKWFEDRYGGRFAKNSGTYAASGAVTITVTGAGSSSAYIFTVGDLFKNYRTGEVMLVATVASSTTITVAAAGRAFGSTSAAAGADGDSLYLIGNVNEENSGARNINTTRTSPETNYTQIFKTTIGISGTENEAGLYGGKDLPYQRGKKGTEHALDIERAFWFGEKKLDANGTQGHPRRATGGVLEFIESGDSYVQNQGGVLTAPDLNTFLQNAFTYGKPTKMLFAGGNVVNAINEIARGQIQTKTGDKTYGISLNSWVTAFGTINIVQNSLFVEDFAGYAFCLDINDFKYCSMANRDTKLMTNVQGNDVDGVVDQYLTEVGLERVNAPKHALLKGVTA